MLAAYLVGGFAVGIGDAFSDVDLQVLVADETAAELAESWVELVHRIIPTVYVQPFPTLNPAAPRQPPNNGGGVCITPDWLHFDVVFRAASRSTPTPSSAWSPSSTRLGSYRRAGTRPDRRDRSVLSGAGGHHVPLHDRQRRRPPSGGTSPSRRNGVIMMRDIGLIGLLLAEQGLASTREHNAGNRSRSPSGCGGT